MTFISYLILERPILRCRLILDVVTSSSKVSSHSEPLGCPIVSTDTSSTDSEKDSFENFLLLIVLSLSFIPLLVSSCLMDSKTSFMDNRDLIEEFDIVDVVDVCLDLGAVFLFNEGR